MEDKIIFEFAKLFEKYRTSSKAMQIAIEDNCLIIVSNDCTEMEKETALSTLKIILRK